MSKHSRRGVVRLVALCGSAVVLMALILGPLAALSTGQVETSPAARLVELDMIFHGARSCSSAQCHGKSGDDSPPTEPSHEYTIWRERDRHTTEAYENLRTDLAKSMGDALKIENVQTSATCLSCHALNVPEKLRGENYSIKEGVTCTSCHGPSEKWLKPHEEKGWAAQQRGKFPNHEALLKQWGLYDTKPLVARAPICSGCHLAIDADLVAAGHPQPHFELEWYQNEQPKHWIDPDEPYFGTKVWIAGQVVCVRDAMTQLAMRVKQQRDAELVNSAYHQAMAHVTALLFAADIVKLDAAAVQANLQKLSEAMSDAAANADAIASAAGEISSLADRALAGVDAVKADKQMTMRLLGAIASDEKLAKEYDSFGMKLQARSIHSLFKAHTDTETVADAENIFDKIYELADADAEAYAGVLNEVRGKLPK